MRRSWADWKVGEPFEAPIGRRNRDGKTTDVFVLVTCPNGCEPFRMAHACVRYNKGAMCISHLARAKCGLAASGTPAAEIGAETGAKTGVEAGVEAGGGEAGGNSDIAQRAENSNGAQGAQADQDAGQSTTGGREAPLFSPEVAALPPSKRSRPTRETHKQCREQIADLQAQLDFVSARTLRLEKRELEMTDAFGASPPRSPPQGGDEATGSGAIGIESVDSDTRVDNTAARAARAVKRVVESAHAEVRAEVDALRSKARNQELMLKCVVCLERERCMVLDPCQHACLCRECAERIYLHPDRRPKRGGKCPLCREEVTNGFHMRLC